VNQLNDASEDLIGYDPFGGRIQKTVNGVITAYVYDGPNIVTQYDGSGNPIAGYVFSLAIDDPLSVTQGGAAYFYHKDSLGTTTDLTDSTGLTIQAYDYDSFGNIIGTSGTLTQPFTFTGREYDAETGLYFYRARYYDPQAGRFISRDPLGFAAGDVNTYRYVGNSSPNYVDPWGLELITAKEAQMIIQTAQGWEGTPYFYGGKSKKGADCSGSTWAIYTEAGFPYKYLSSSSFPSSTRFLRSPNNIPQVGDIGWWNGHMVIYDPAAGEGRNVWSAFNTEGAPYGTAPLSWFSKKRGQVQWFRYDKP
jgi:RHS repeat-associated protein